MRKAVAFGASWRTIYQFLLFLCSRTLHTLVGRISKSEQLKPIWVSFSMEEDEGMAEDGEILVDDKLSSDELFDLFVKCNDLLDAVNYFYQLCESLDINPKNYKTIYSSLKAKLTSWRCKNLWNKLDKRAKHVDYKNKPCAKLKVLVIGAGPCGLRAAVELAFLGAQVVVLEKRDSFSRNNVLHLWPFLIVDLKNLGAKTFYGKFCAGSLDHISEYLLSFIKAIMISVFNFRFIFLCITSTEQLKLLWVNHHLNENWNTRLDISMRLDLCLVCSFLILLGIFAWLLF